MFLEFYDLAIGNDVVNDQSSKQLNADHISSDSLQTETKGSYQINLISADYKLQLIRAKSIVIFLFLDFKRRSYCKWSGERPALWTIQRGLHSGRNRWWW